MNASLDYVHAKPALNSARKLLGCLLDFAASIRYIAAMTGQGKDQDKDERAARLAEALRLNLHRRKSQARQRKATESDTKSGSEELPDDV